MNEREMGEKKKGIYSVEFEAMLERIEKEDNAERSSAVRKSRLCLQQVRALEKHFEAEDKLQPERKLQIAREVGLQPRQVAVWFQNRRARWKSKQLEKQYDELRADYDALKHDFGSLQQHKLALLSQLTELKTRIEAQTLESNTNISNLVASSSCDASNASTSMKATLPISSASSSSSSFHFSPCLTLDDLQPCKSKAHQNQQKMRADTAPTFNYEDPCNIFSVDQPPSLHWYHGDHFAHQ